MSVACSDKNGHGAPLPRCGRRVSESSTSQKRKTVFCFLFFVPTIRLFLPCRFACACGPNDNDTWNAWKEGDPAVHKIKRRQACLQADMPITSTHHQITDVACTVCRLSSYSPGRGAEGRTCHGNSLLQARSERPASNYLRKKKKRDRRTVCAEFQSQLFLVWGKANR